MKLQELRAMAKELGVDSPTTFPKRELVLKIMEKNGVLVDESELPAPPKRRGGRPKKEPGDAAGFVECVAPQPAQEPSAAPAFRPRSGLQPIADEQLDPEVTQLLSDGDCEDCEGILEITAEGFGFLRAQNYLPGPHDIYVANTQIRRFELKTGDKVRGKARTHNEGKKFRALLYITSINDRPPEEALDRRCFDDMTPIFPNQRYTMEREGGEQDQSADRRLQERQP